MLPTTQLRFVERVIQRGYNNDNPQLILQQWWTKVGDAESGEWRDVPLAVDRGIQEADEEEKEAQT